MCTDRLLNNPIFILTSITLLMSYFAFGTGTPKGQPQYPTAIKEISGNRFLISNKGPRTVALYDDGFKAPLQTWSFEEVPTGMAVHGDYAYITTFETVGKVHFLNIKTGKIEKSLVTGSGANAPVLSANGETLYVLNRFQHTVTKIDPDRGKIISSVSVLREPAGAVTGQDGKYLFVANFLPAQRADVDTVAACVSVIDLDDFKKVKDIQLSNGSNALRGICLSPDGKYVFVTHNLGRFQVPTNQLQQGWMNTSAVSVINVETLEKDGTVLMDEPERGAAGIWGIHCAEGKMVIAHSGTHEISLIDYQTFIDKFEACTYKNSLDYDLRFMYSIRERLRLAGNGPRDFIISGGKAFIPTYFSDTLNIFSLADKQIEPVPLVKNRIESDRDKGEKIFNDAHYCFQNWQSCNGCHPGDARTDGLNWDLMNDGIGNPKNCKSLLHSHATPPAMITGVRAMAEIAVRKGFTFIQFAEIREHEAEYVDEYLKSLRSVPSPWLEDGELSELAEKGKEVFEKLNCGDCHSGPYFTDMKMHRIGDDVEFEEGWDTPALIEVWRTAPYLFDGRAASLKEVFDTFGHGIRGEVPAKDIDALVEYIRSL